MIYQLFGVIKNWFADFLQRVNEKNAQLMLEYRIIMMVALVIINILHISTFFYFI